MQLKTQKHIQHIIQAGFEERTVQFILKEVMFGFICGLHGMYENM